MICFKYALLCACFLSLKKSPLLCLGRFTCVANLQSLVETHCQGFPLVLHTGVDRNLEQDESMWDWFAPVGRADSGDTATEIIYPKRLVQQIKSEEEMAHDYLGTRVKNSTGDTLVSLSLILFIPML